MMSFAKKFVVTSGISPALQMAPWRQSCLAHKYKAPQRPVLGVRFLGEDRNRVNSARNQQVTNSRSIVHSKPAVRRHGTSDFSIAFFYERALLAGGLQITRGGSFQPQDHRWHPAIER